MDSGAHGFNPRLAPKSEAMLRPRNLSPRQPCFNPRLAPKSEAIECPARLEFDKQGFNPRLAPKSEAMSSSLQNIS